jgi:hypothetical protein
MVGLVPKIGRHPCPEKCRGRGHGAGAEDGELWRRRVRSNAAERQEVRVIARGACGMAGADEGQARAG